MDKTELRNSVIIKDPQIHETAFIAPGAHVVGDVILKRDSSIWYNTVARADINQITIGERSNVQDNSVIHLENDQGVIIGNDVTIYHNVTLGGIAPSINTNDQRNTKRHPTLQDNVVVGSGAQILGPVVVGRNSLIGANAVVTKDVPEKSIMIGIPAKRVGDATKGFKPYAVTDKEE